MWVSRIIFDEDNNATGIEYQRDVCGRRAALKANREVIISAGAINTPPLLMLTSIGPADHPNELGIEDRADSTGVGSNLHDHPEAVTNFETTVDMVSGSTQWWEIGIFTQIDEDTDLPDLMMHYGSVPFDMHTLRQGYPTAENSFALTPNV